RAGGNTEREDFMQEVPSQKRAMAGRGRRVENSPDAGAPSPAAVIIIGGGMGGLSAAIYLRLAGYEVTIYEANERVGGRANLIERDGFRFDTGPSLLNYPWVFERLFETAGRRLGDYVKVLAVDPSVSFQWADGERLTLSSDVRRLLAECERVEPGSRPAMLAFLRDAGAKYRTAFEKLVSGASDNPARWLGRLSLGELARLGVWRSLDGELGRFFRSRYLREALGSYAMYLGGSPYELPGLFSILPYGEMAYGLWLPAGGIYGLVEGVERLARELGVIIYTGQRVRHIITQGRQVTGVELADGHMHRSRLVVSNVDAPTTKTELIGDGALAARMRVKTKMTPGALTFYWGVRGRVEEIGHHTIFLPRDCRAAFADLFREKRIPRDLPFYACVPSATDPTLAPTGDSVMFVLAPMPLLSQLPRLDWAETTRAVKAQVLERLRRHGLDLAPERIVVEEVYTPKEWQRRFGLYDGSAFGAAHTFFQVGPFRARNYDEEVDGLFYVGASTTPGTGLPMVTLSGKLVAERIQQKWGGHNSQRS
ncbi:MAG TPA: phytoene desaturase family protein, partial [Blastocatellia bacterium]|nr:phytoene desaturase family protein [Blastocatellia bacterium]